MSSIDTFYQSSLAPKQAYELKTCEICTRQFTRPVPVDAKHGQKLCIKCAAKPVITEAYMREARSLDLFSEAQPRKRRRTKKEMQETREEKDGLVLLHCEFCNFPCYNPITLRNHQKDCSTKKALSCTDTLNLQKKFLKSISGIL